MLLLGSCILLPTKCNVEFQRKMWSPYLPQGSLLYSQQNQAEKEGGCLFECSPFKKKPLFIQWRGEKHDRKEKKLNFFSSNLCSKSYELIFDFNIKLVKPSIQSHFIHSFIQFNNHYITIIFGRSYTWILICHLQWCAYRCKPSFLKVFQNRFVWRKSS